MEHNLSTPLTISALARELCVSPTTLKEAFRTTYGTPVYAWYRRLRMEYAARLMLDEGCTVAAAARGVGYANASKFSAAFAMVIGEAPSAWLAHHRGVGTSGDWGPPHISDGAVCRAEE